MAITIMILVAEMILLAAFLCFIYVLFRRDMKRYQKETNVTPNKVVHWMINNLPEENKRRRSA